MQAHTLLLIALVGGACRYEVSFRNCAVVCAANDCPAGFGCLDGLCVEPGVTSCADVDATGDGVGPCVAATPTFGALAITPIANAGHLAVGDLDGDGDKDIVVATGDDTVLVRNNGDGSFDAPQPLRSASSTPAIGVRIADTDGDGRNDVVTWIDGEFSISPQDAGEFVIRVFFTLPNQETRVVVGRFNADLGFDLAVGTGDEITIFLGSTTTAGVAAAGQVLNNVTAQFVADVDGDGNNDLLTNFPGTNAMGMSFGNGDGSFGNTGIDDGLTRNSAVGRFSSDQNLSLIAHSGSGMVFRMRQTAPRTFAMDLEPLGFTLVDGLDPIQVLDINGDGRDDIAGLGQFVLQCSPAGPIGQFVLPVVDYGVTAPVAATLIDVNNDGKPDIVETKGNGLFVGLQQ